MHNMLFCKKRTRIITIQHYQGSTNYLNSVMLIFKQICKYLSHTLYVSIVAFIFSSLTLASENNINTINQFSIAKGNAKIVKSLTNPIEKSTYFISTNNGKLSLFSLTEPQIQPIIDIKASYPKLISFNSIALHPDFALNQNKGFLILYTAHTEPTDEKKRTFRLQSRTNKVETEFENVLLEWQLSTQSSGLLTLKTQQPREVLRIPMIDQGNTLTAITFNPFIKPWQEQYAQLYLLLGASEKQNKSPLYSGSVLRITPEKYGLKSFNSPNSNPFIGNKEINDEIVATGLGKVIDIVFSKDTEKQLFIQKVGQDSKQFSIVSMGDDWREKAPKSNQLIDINHARSNAVYYRGKAHPKHRNQLIYLAWDTEWKIHAISTKPPYKNQKIQDFKNSQLNKNSLLFLATTHDNELLFIDKNTGLGFQPHIHLGPPTNIVSNEAAPNAASEATSHSALFYIAFIAFIITGTAIWFKKSNKLAQVKRLLHRDFAKFHWDPQAQQLNLYHRHSTEIAQNIAIDSITNSEVYLNDALVSQISADEGQGFTHLKEQQFDHLIAMEKREKIFDNKVRKLTLLLTDNAQKTYSICIYLRKGNQRLTRANFDESVNLLKDWCWLFATLINPTHSEKRKVVEVTQTARPSEKALSTNTVKQSKTVEDKEKQNTTIEHSVTPKDPVIHQQAQPKKNSTAHSKFQDDIVLIQSLEKLGKLKQQGLITEDEFNLTKQKLIEDLTSS